MESLDDVLRYRPFRAHLSLLANFGQTPERADKAFYEWLTMSQRFQAANGVCQIGTKRPETRRKFARFVRGGFSQTADFEEITDSRRMAPTMHIEVRKYWKGGN